MKNITKRKYEIITLENKIDVIIPENVYNEIVYLTRLIDKVEWSGIMFYETEGDIIDISTFKITLKEIFLMDKGSGSFTEYDFNADVVEFWSAEPERSNWKIGHIHSHVGMNVFFSGTDDDELVDNAPNHNYYFSIITNNNLDFEAKVAFLGKSESQNIIEEYKCKKSDGSEYIMKVKIKDATDTVFVHKCEIKTDIPKLIISEEFENRVKKINEEEKKPNYVNNYKSYSMYDDNDDYDYKDDWYTQRFGNGFFNKNKKEKKKGNDSPSYLDHDFLRHILRCTLSPKFSKDDHKLDFLTRVLNDLEKEETFWKKRTFELSLTNIKDHLKSWSITSLSPFEIKQRLTKAIIILEDKEKQFPFVRDYIDMIKKYIN